MIRYFKGNVLLAEAEALVNTVNTVGVMGKGIALQFKEAFPQNFLAYEEACKRDEVQIGKMFVTATNRLDKPKWIINFPTKKDWKHPSKLDYIRSGLKDLVRVIREKNIRSIAVPPLGSGLGGLDWTQVQQTMEIAFSDLDDVEILIYPPTDQYQASPKRTGVEELTDARAMLVDVIRRYSVLGFECTNLEVQKLAYFLQRILQGIRADDPLRLHFIPNKYGPYADALRHALDALDGSYLHCQKRLHDAGPLDPIQLDLPRLDKVEKYVVQHMHSAHRQALDLLDQLIDGFQSPYLMELLASVDWLLKHEPQSSLSTLLTGLRNWPGGRTSGERKAKLFKQDVVELAVGQLRRHTDVLY